MLGEGLFYFFTSICPRGDAVTIPISGSAPLRGQIGLIDNEGDPFQSAV